MHSAGVRNTLNLQCSILEQQRTLVSSYEVLMSRTSFINWWKLLVHHKWWSGNLSPAAGWPPGMSAPCMCNSGWYLISPVFSQQPAPHVIAVFFNWATKKLTCIGFVFVTPGQWVRHNWDFLGTDFGSVPSSWFQGRDHGLKDSTAMDWLPTRALPLLNTSQTFIVESSFVLGKKITDLNFMLL